MNMAKHRVHIQIREEDRAFWATVDEYPGVLASGDDLEGLRRSLEEGICLMKAEPDGDVPELRLSELEFGSGEALAMAELVPA
jgi:predicted RNase H-like HicB family nuclease